ncbi:MAG: hypothetical protein LBE59_03575 [Nevskiaceae bacterium]|nr:hypothetical protein [Nevskiaceae bacterium]
MLAGISKAWRTYRASTGLGHELTTLALMLLVGLFVLPPLIWLAGHLTLGDYTRSYAGTPTGGPLALWIDFLRGLAAGSVGYWLVLLGPWVLLKWLQIAWAVIARAPAPARRREPPPPKPVRRDPTISD